MIRGDLTAREFIALWTTEGLVVADMNVNIWDVTDEIQPLIRSGVRVDPVRLADPATLLTDLSQRNAARGYPLPIYRPTAARSA